MRTRQCRALGFVVVLGGIAFALPAAAYGEGPLEPDFGELISSVVNFAIYIGIIAFFGGKAIQGYFASRREKITAGIREAAEMREEAERRLGEYSAKLDAFEAERERLLSEFREIGARERDRLVEEAEAQAERILSDAKLAAEQELRRARRTLEQELLDRAFALAREQVVRDLDTATKSALLQASIREVRDAANAPTSN